MSAQRALVIGRSAGVLDLEEAFEPPDLEDAFADQHAHLEDAPPFDPGVGRFGRVAVGALAHHDVALFVFYLGQEFGELFYWEGREALGVGAVLEGVFCWKCMSVGLTFALQGVLGCFRLGYVDYAVHVETDFFRVGRPGVVAETVGITSVLWCCEGVVARGNAVLADLVSVGRGRNLCVNYRQHP